MDVKKNFCRVFKLPGVYPNQFLFRGPVDVKFSMVDWFCPVRPDEVDDFDINDQDCLDILRSQLEPFLLPKVYVKPGCRYILMTDFNFSFMFKGK